MEQPNSNQNQLNIDPAHQNFAKQNLGGQVKIMEEEKMKGGYFYYYLLVLVIIVSGVWLFWKGGETEFSPKEVSEKLTEKVVVNEEAGVRTGTLKASDNSARGNLMLISEEKDTLYISTVRDFSSLLNKEAEVRTEPAEKGFKLLDIVAK